MSSLSTADLHPNAQALVRAAKLFLHEVENLTPGKDLEARLNAQYGLGNHFYDSFADLIRHAIEGNEGWLANVNIDRDKYRRSKICEPSEETRYFSITAVFMDSTTEYRGQYHVHPYGEINCVVPLTPEAELLGMQGWQGAGWTSPGPGTHHYPTVRHGSLVALFFLPAGRISYDIRPDAPQPLSI